MSDPVTPDVRNAELHGPVLAALAAQLGASELLAALDAFAEQAGGPDRTVLEAVLAALESRGLVGSAEIAARVAGSSPWRSTPFGLWLAARLLELRGEAEPALEAWDQIVQRHWGPSHEALLSRARLNGRLGRLDRAFADLRSAAAGQEEHAFLSRAARLLARLRKQGRPGAARQTRIALLSSTTTDLVAPLIQLACFRDGVDAEMYVAPYGNVKQEILNPASGLYGFKPDFVIVATNWRDANLPAFSDTPQEPVERTVAEVRLLWQALLEQLPCRIIQHNFDVPAVDSYGYLGTALPGGRAAMLREINRRLVEGAPPAVAVLDLELVSAAHGKRSWYDAPYWHLAKQYPAAGALPLLVDHYAALIRAGLGLARKVLVLDLDNTLWGGVIGEDGLEGIRLGPPSAAGEAFAALQRYALELKQRGILLAVCSKNNEEDARLPFLKHDETVLRLDDFVIFRANWLDKPTNLREIAARLNLGIDSFVFLDDNPVERALVRREIPEIAVPELGKDPATFVGTLDRERYFEAWALSEEDRERHQSYRGNVLREETKMSAATLEEFLGSLAMEAEIGPFDDLVLARVVQLIGKTNQFNLTTRRYSEAQVREMALADDYWTQYFKLGDRFGDNGLIGVMIAHGVAGDRAAWEIDTWLMSCRVIGRQMEEFMLETLAGAAEACGVETLRGTYIPTRKNGMVADLYPRLGFAKVGETSDGGRLYELDLRSHPMPHCSFIRLRSSMPRQQGAQSNSGEG